MRTVVTGATGLIGSALMKELDGIGLTRGESQGKLFHTDYSVQDMEHHFEGADVVIHLASIRGKGNDYQHFMGNVVLTEDVLKAALAASVKKVIFMSSIAVYSDLNNLPWREDQRISPQTFYALSKITGEHLCEMYARRGLCYTIFRCGIVLGKTKDHRMADIFMERAANRDTIVLNGECKARRDFIYVKDVVSALLWAVSRDGDNEVFNLGSGNAYTNLEIALAANKAFGNDKIEYHSEIPESITDSYMTSEKLEAAGFCAQYTLQSAIEDIASAWSE